MGCCLALVLQKTGIHPKVRGYRLCKVLWACGADFKSNYLQKVEVVDYYIL
jgi:hypothetical protein